MTREERRGEKREKEEEKWREEIRGRRKRNGEEDGREMDRREGPRVGLRDGKNGNKKIKNGNNGEICKNKWIK